jgi:hypothetical protein
MNNIDLDIYLKELGWSKAELARRIDVDPKTVSRWKKIPGPVAAYLRLVRRIHTTWESA